MTTPPDPVLRALLRRADPAAGLDAASPDAFAAAVRARIELTDTAYRRASSARPRSGQLLPLAAALAVLASLGAGSAIAYARERDVRSDAFATAIARSIDPWQMHAARPVSGHEHP